ncbi:calcium:proton antiporter [Aquabacterium sp. OR-4]|uniref:calcium:proton antiporter n=1 Tax=Aquabacterium sp. OR-4 TaxID=2978127 RepID=UPI0021B1670F|nr:ionic transporter y4hA [Aquabacterium sp. OR-4]MDT7833945.1 ionic transporter y4hA [Aquabacterium sp. OR-4]
MAHDHSTPAPARTGHWRLPASLPAWSLAGPLLAALAVLALALAAGLPLGIGLGTLLTAALFGAVMSAIHHAEVVAHRVGEPFGTLVLAVAVTVIEVALIVTLMLAGGEQANALARDTVYSAIMIVCNGIVGLCMVIGAARHGVLAYRVDGTSPALAALAALAGLALVLPNFTTTTPGPTYSGAQLAFAGVASLTLYGVYVFVQTVRHRDYFLPVDQSDHDAHLPPPPNGVAWAAFGLLLLSLVGVVGLAKALAPALEAGVASIGAPKSLVGVLIALIVLLPETGAAVRAARGNRMQSSLNLALGSGLASIGLTIPVVAAMSPLFPFPLVLGMPPMQIVLLTLSLLVGAITLGSGRATVLHGAVHLVLFGAFLFLAVVP